MTHLANGNYEVQPEELQSIIVTAISEYKRHETKSLEILYRQDVMKDLNISKEKMRRLLNHKRRPPMIGTIKKLQISRPLFEKWKENNWGQFDY